MEYVELVASAIQSVCEADGVEGVRLSPFRLEPSEPERLVRALTAKEGLSYFIAISCPGVERLDQGRWLVCGDDEAATRATAWRNEILSGAGERIVYISFERWGREGGLRGTLHELGESDLMDQLKGGAEVESPLPRSVRTALSGYASPRELCALSAAVHEPSQPWPAIGAALPEVGLARDSSLAEEDAEERLRLNHEFVTRAISNQARRSGGKFRDDLTRYRRERASGGAADPLDLGRYTTEELQQGLGEGKAATRKKSAKKKAKKKATKKKTTKRGAERQQASTPGEPADGPGPEGGGGDGLEGDAGAGEPRLAVLSQAIQPLPEGTLSALGRLAQALLDARGVPLELTVNGAARSALERSLTKSADPVPRGLDSEGLEASLLERAEAAQDRLASLTRGRSPRERASLTGLLRAPVLALFDEDLRAAAEEVLQAEVELLRAATESGRAGLAAAALLRDTVQVRSRSFGQLLLLGPLHPLWLGQALLRHAEVSRDLDELTLSELRVIARAHQQAPAAPAEFPLGGGEVGRLAPALGGLICFEAQPGLAGSEVLAELGEQLVEAFAEVHPYAQLGLKVRLWGESPPSLVEGMARQLSEGGRLSSLHLQCERGLGELGERAASAALESGRLTIGPHVDVLMPHLEVVVGEPADPPMTDEPADADVFGISSGELRTEFEPFLGGLRARTLVEGVHGVAEVERALAVASHSVPQGSFTLAPRGYDLSRVARPARREEGTWSVVLGSHLTRVRSPEQKLLALESRGAGLQVAVLTHALGPAGRALGQSLQLMGLPETSEWARTTLAERLESLSRGVLSLGRRPSKKLATLLLHRELLSQLGGAGTECVVAEVEGHHLRAMSGVPASLPGGVCLGLAGGREPRLVLAYAAIEAGLEWALARRHLGGELAEFLGGLVESLKAASSTNTLAARCAQEALDWLLLPAALEDERAAPQLLELVRRVTRGERAVELEVWIYLPLEDCPPPVDRTAQLKGCGVSFRTLDRDLVNKVLYSSSV